MHALPKQCPKHKMGFSRCDQAVFIVPLQRFDRFMCCRYAIAPLPQFCRQFAVPQLCNYATTQLCRQLAALPPGTAYRAKALQAAASRGRSDFSCPRRLLE